MRELEVVGVRVELPTNQPVVLLREVGGARNLPIWIGAVEASAIAQAQQGVAGPRPLTHELFVTVIADLGDSLDQIRIVDVSDGVFYAELVFASGVVVSARPSDSIALALRASIPIMCAESVLEIAAIGSVEDDADEEIERFREFLDTVDPEDFQQ